MSEAPVTAGFTHGRSTRMRRVIGALFVIVPLLMIPAMVHVLLDLHRDQFLEDQRRILRERLWRLADQANPFQFMPQVARDLYEKIGVTGESPADIENAYQKVTSTATLPFDLYVYNASGTLIESRTHPESTRTFMQSVWMYHRTQSEEHFNAVFRQIKQSFGQYFNFQYFSRCQGQTLPINGRNGNGLILWLAGPKRQLDGLIVVMNEVPPLSQFLDRAAQTMSQAGISLWMTGTEGEERCLLQDARTTSAGVGTDSLRLQIEESLQFQNVRVRAVGMPVWKLSPIKSALNAVFLALMLLLLLAGIAYGDSFDQIFISIKTKLYVLFLYLTVVATLGFLTLGLRQVSDREAVAFADAGKAAQETLSRIDSGFTTAMQDCLRFFRSLRDDRNLRAGNLPPFLQRIRGQTLNWLEVRYPSGNLFYSTQKRDHDIEFVNKSNAKRNIERFIPERLPAGTAMTYSPPEIMVQSVVETPVSGWLRIFEAPDEIHIMRFGQFALWFYWDVYRDPQAPFATITMNKNQHVAAWEYLSKRLRERFSHGRTAMRVTAWRPDYRLFLPADFRFWPEFTQLVQRATTLRETLTEKLRRGGEEVLVTAMPGKQLTGMTLAVVYPLSEMHDETRAYRRNIGLTVFGSLLLALLIGWLLSRAFLRPIAELDRGVQALAQRNPEVRLRVLDRDEFGDLARTFNRTIEDIGEMLFASSLQSQLIPTAAPAVEGYEMMLANVTATDLGGDYCDLVLLPDGRLFFLIGDVTGHGASSALVMAMAKAAVFRFARQPQSITCFMDDLNRLLLGCLGRKKLMTVFAGLLDPINGAISFSNGGHPSPLIVRANGGMESLDLFHVPVGGYPSRRFPYEERTASLQPGDLLVLYTDGITELTNARGECWGVDGFQAFLREHRLKPLGELKQMILDFLRRYTGTPRFEDDVTFILIRRHSELKAPRVI